MKLLAAICIASSILGFCSAESNKNCFFEKDEETAKQECPVGYFKLEDCNNKFKCFGKRGDWCISNSRKVSNTLSVCSRLHNLECAKDLTRLSDYGQCEDTGNFPNYIKRKSIPALFRQRYPFALTFNSQNTNNANNDESDYPIDDKFLY